MDNARPESHPVARGRQVAAAGRLVQQPSGRLGRDLAGLRVDTVGATMLDRDAAGRETALGVRRERRFEFVAPAEMLERGRACVQLELLSGTRKGRAVARPGTAVAGPKKNALS